MKAIYFDGSEPIFRDDLPQPAPGPGEALLKVRKAGVCRTDLEILKGYMGFTGVMGHEFVGEVVEGPAEWLGRRVVAEINCLAHASDESSTPPPSGKSLTPPPLGEVTSFFKKHVGGGGLAASPEKPSPDPASQQLRRTTLSQGERSKSLPKNHDPSRTVLGIAGRDGCFAETIVVPVENLHAVPDNVDDDAASFVEPLAAACRILEQVDVSADDRIAIFGDGRLGLLCAFVLRTRGEQVLLVGRHAEKLALAEKRGIETKLAGDADVSKSLNGFDIVVDATGQADGFAAAMAAVRPLGTLVLKSTVAAETGMNLAPLVINEVTVVGSRCGPFAPAIALLERGDVDPRDLITARYPLEEGLASLQAAANGKNIKVLIDVE